MQKNNGEERQNRRRESSGDKYKEGWKVRKIPVSSSNLSSSADSLCLLSYLPNISHTSFMHSTIKINCQLASEIHLSPSRAQTWPYLTLTQIQIHSSYQFLSISYQFRISFRSMLSSILDTKVIDSSFVFAFFCSSHWFTIYLFFVSDFCHSAYDCCFASFFCFVTILFHLSCFCVSFWWYRENIALLGAIKQQTGSFCRCWRVRERENENCIVSFLGSEWGSE